jgi:hypothetical protein
METNDPTTSGSTTSGSTTNDPTTSGSTTIGLPTTVTFKPDDANATVSINGKVTNIELNRAPIDRTGKLKPTDEIKNIKVKEEGGAGGEGGRAGGGGDGLNGGSSRKFRKKVGGRRGKGKSKKHSSSRKSKY